MRPPLSLEEAVGLPEIPSLSHLTLQELCHDVLASTRIRGPAGPASESGSWRLLWVARERGPKRVTAHVL